MKTNKTNETNETLVIKLKPAIIPIKKAAKRLIISGNSVTITSKLKTEDIAKLQKYAPQTLKIFERDVNDDAEEIFCINARAKAPAPTNKEVSKYGITFLNTTETGNASISVLIDPSITDKKAFVRDEFSEILSNLMAIEEHAIKELKRIDSRHKTVEEMILVVDAEV